MARRDRITLEQLRNLEPLSSLSTARLEELVPLTDIEELGIGHGLFREGDIDNQTIFLLDGDVQMSTADGKLDCVFSHRMDEARFPLDDSQPRQVSCTALTRVKVARIDNSVLEYMLMWDQMAVSEQINQQQVNASSAKSKSTPLPESVAEPAPGAEPVSESGPSSSASVELSPQALESETVTPFPARKSAVTEASGDRGWIRKIRQVMAFKNLPPANIKTLLERMETVQVKAGEPVIKQGEVGDYYYVLTDGTASVSRIVELATLEGGASFGEEALLCGGTRNATVTMLSDGSLMRLSKQDFDELLKEPMLNRLSIDEAMTFVNSGARWLDVRYAKEHHHGRIPGSINIPLHELRARLDELEPKGQYVCYCGTGRRSSAAAFLLAQKGFHASVLNGGTRVIPQQLERVIEAEPSARRPVQGTAP